MKIFNTKSIPVIPLPIFIKVMNEYSFTNSDTLRTEGKLSLTSLLPNYQKERGKIKIQFQQNVIKLYEIVWRKRSTDLHYQATNDIKY